MYIFNYRSYAYSLISSHAYSFIGYYAYSFITGYAYSQGISESILGILMAAGSIFGIIGTFTYPRLQRRIGLERTGLFGLGSEIFCLCFCVAAVFAPGSPFDLLHRTRDSPSQNISMVLTTPSVMVDTIDNNTITYNITDISNISKTHSKPSSYISIGLYLGGLITARFGKCAYILIITWWSYCSTIW